jgi:Myosin tail
LEKTKSSLEAANADLTVELKQVTTAKQEVERRRKQAESQGQEHSIRLAELDRVNTDLTEKVAHLQVCWLSYNFEPRFVISS